MVVEEYKWRDGVGIASGRRWCCGWWLNGGEEVGFMVGDEMGVVEAM